MKKILLVFIIFLLNCSNELPENISNDDLDIKNNEEQIDSVYHYVRAHRYLEINNLSAAESRFKKVIELEPDFARGFLGLANVKYLTNRLDEAKEYNKEALNLKPDLEESLYLSGLIDKKLNKCSSFIKNKNYEDYSYNPLILILGLCFEIEGKSKEANEIFSNNIKSTETNLIEAEYEFYLNNFEKSLSLIYEYITENENAEAYLLIGNILLGQGKIEEANINFQEAMNISKNPKIPLFYSEAKSLYEETKSN